MESTAFSKIERLLGKVTYRVSPLFELAASLHLLARQSTAGPLHDWVNSALHQLTQERLGSDWNYFAPVFTRAIPWILHPDQTKGLDGMNELYDYVTNLPVRRFREAFSLSLHGELIAEVKNPCLVEIDLQRDPEFVKGRFVLFLSAYWETIFSRTWEQVKPRFAKETQEIEQALQDKERFLAFLRSIPIVRDQLRDTDDDIGQKSLVPLAEICQITLYPSLFYTDVPQLHIQQDAGHLLYHMEDRHT
jgi:hypothetical protein